jgi:hypothetical protein
MNELGIRRSQIEPNWSTLRTTEALLKGVYLPPMQLHTNLAFAIDMLDRYLRSKCPPERTLHFTVAEDARSQPIFVTFYSLSAYDFLLYCQATTEACFSITDAAVAVQMK